MNKNSSFLPWYGNNNLRNAVNLCLDAIKESGLSAAEAISIPECLKMAIQRSNSLALSQSDFNPVHIEVEIKDGGIDLIIPAQ